MTPETADEELLGIFEEMYESYDMDEFWEVRGVAADWCEDHGGEYASWGEVLRWSVTEKNRPYMNRGMSGSHYHWYNEDKVTLGIDVESDLSAALYSFLPKGGKEPLNDFYREYTGYVEAELALWTAHLKLTGRRDIFYGVPT